MKTIRLLTLAIVLLAAAPALAQDQVSPDTMDADTALFINHYASIDPAKKSKPIPDVREGARRVPPIFKGSTMRGLSEIYYFIKSAIN